MQRRLLQIKPRWLFSGVVLSFIAIVLWYGLQPSTGAAPSGDLAAPQDQRCWIGVRINTIDDLRAGRDSFARIEVLFWRGERIGAQIALPGESLTGRNQRAWRFPAQPPDLRSRFPNEVRRVTLAYKLDPGDGILLRPDTWTLADPQIAHYCTNADVSENDDPFLGLRTSLFEESYIRLPFHRTGLELSGANTLTLFEDRGRDPSVCYLDRDCDDGVYCNGTEICGRARPGTNGCRPGSRPRCGPNESCFEAGYHSRALYYGCLPNSCANPDTDRDLFPRWECGGTDCNDNDELMIPWRDQDDYWDLQNKDNDCDPRTNGAARNFRGIRQVCDGQSSVIVIGGRDRDGSGGFSFQEDKLTRVACVSGSVCVPQPSGEGVCTGRPDGYVPPPAFGVPLVQTGYDPGWVRRDQRSIKGIPRSDISPIVRPTPKTIPIKP